MPELMALTCPVCAAPLQPNSDRCSYCGSLIYIKTDVPHINLKELNQSVIEESITAFRKRVRTDQYDQEAHYGLGVADFNLGLVDEAVDELTQAARLMPENPDIQVQLAVVLRSSFSSGNAAAESQMNARLNKALLLRPDHVEANMLKAEGQLSQGDYAEARNTLQPMMLVDPERTRPKMATVLESLGTQQLARNNWKGAQRCWINLDPLDNRTAKNLAVRFLNQNSSQLPRSIRLGEAVRSVSSHSGDSGAGRIGRTVLAVIGGLVGGFVAWIILAAILNIGTDTISGWRTAVFLVGFVGFLASPVVAGTRYWKKSGAMPVAPASVVPASQGKVSREDLLSGRAGSAAVYQAADELIGKLIRANASN